VLGFNACEYWLSKPTRPTIPFKKHNPLSYSRLHVAPYRRNRTNAKQNGKETSGASSFETEKKSLSRYCPFAFPLYSFGSWSPNSARRRDALYYYTPPLRHLGRGPALMAYHCR